ncbi:hypothetical protein [Cryobacterium sp. PH31-O1]|uniref:hypothetical protein n=1 Tax=Cryobacterium sp. PH31-O1 TaxID=3046306 RepID=UPI0024B9C472|nr:hypothetical protein [Cryobacterium sp. PH31-O1]MDJ0337447.1 hypothetical protein [Cryobacterium sp. PH31-O1]
MTKTDSLDLTAIRARADAAANGPWWWGGNVDNNSDVGLRGPGNGHGVIDVMRTSTEDIEEDAAGKEWDSTDASDYIDRDGYIQWRTENPKSHLCFLREDEMFIEPARDLAIFEVARNQKLPDDTPRGHPKVYRGDVVGVRNANAEFIAHARTDIPALLAEVTRLSSQDEGRQTRIRELLLEGDRLRAALRATE